MQRLEPVLSREEIETLLAGNSPRARARMEPIGIDLLADDRHLRTMLPTLQIGFARLAESLRRIFASVLRTKVEIREEAAEIVSGRGMVNVAERAACIIALRVVTGDGASAFAVLALDPVLTFSVIERMFGGGGGPPKTPSGRSPTSLERRMLLRALAPLFEALDATLEPPGYFRFEVHSVESRLDLVPGFTPDTTALHVPFTLELGQQLASFSLSLPAAVLEPLRARIGAPTVDVAGAAAMPHLVADVRVTLSVVLGRAAMPLRQLLRLQPGMVLALDQGRSEPLTVEIEGVPKFEGTPVAQDGMVAVELTRKQP
jgi:flagellar motor switch protein FliM